MLVLTIHCDMVENWINTKILPTFSPNTIQRLLVIKSCYCIISNLIITPYSAFPSKGRVVSSSARCQLRKRLLQLLCRWRRIATPRSTSNDLAGAALRNWERIGVFWCREEKPRSSLLYYEFSSLNDDVVSDGGGYKDATFRLTNDNSTFVSQQVYIDSGNKKTCFTFCMFDLWHVWCWQQWWWQFQKCRGG